MPVDRRAPGGGWTSDELIAAVRRPTPERKLELLREVGILDASGRLAKEYRSWGKRVSRTSMSYDAARMQLWLGRDDRENRGRVEPSPRR
jgi:hypothetical protein